MIQQQYCSCNNGVLYDIVQYIVYGTVEEGYSLLLVEEYRYSSSTRHGTKNFISTSTYNSSINYLRWYSSSYIQNTTYRTVVGSTCTWLHALL